MFLKRSQVHFADLLGGVSRYTYRPAEKEVVEKELNRARLSFSESLLIPTPASAALRRIEEPFLQKVSSMRRRAGVGKGGGGSKRDRLEVRRN